MEWWTRFTDWASALADKPIVITLVGIFTVVGAAFIIFSKTSIGKKSLKKLADLHRLGVEKASQTLKKVEEVETLAKEKIAELEAQYEQKTNELTVAYEQKVATLVSIVNYYEESLFLIADKIPNVKVQNQVAEVRKNYEEKKKEISNVIGVIYQDHALALENAKANIRKEYDEKISYLQNQIAQIRLYFSEIDNIEPKEGEDNNG